MSDLLQLADGEKFAVEIKNRAGTKAELAYINHKTRPIIEDALVAGMTVTYLQPYQTPFQNRVSSWMEKTFGQVISNDRTERNHRFLEEALELVQSCGLTASEAHQLVDYVFGRPVGERRQEYGGVMVTLAAHALAHGEDMSECGEIELARVWTKVEEIRAKQAAKPKHSPLPEPEQTKWLATIYSIAYRAGEMKLMALQEGEVPQEFDSGTVVEVRVVNHD